MRNANNIATNIVQIFRNAIPDRCGDPVPAEKIAQLTLDIKTILDSIEQIDKTTITKLRSEFETVLDEFGSDIPNDDKDDIIFIVEEYINTLAVN